MKTNEPISISIVIPVFNEGINASQTIIDLKKEMNSLNIEYEIIAVNDGSTDNTKNALREIENIKLISHPYNKGYGAALKTGVANSKYNWVMFFDSDGQHKPIYIKDFLKYTEEYDLIAGNRSGGKYVRPTLRKPGLWLLRTIANYLVEHKIPDLNCGMRLIKKDVLGEYLHLMPNTFSMSTTSTLAFLKDKRNVKFIPIEVEKRNDNSKSTVRPKDAITTMMLIFRLIMIFSPLRIFFPVSLALFLIGLAFLTYDIIIFNISEATILILITSILIFFFGLIADQIAALRREINHKN